MAELKQNAKCKSKSNIGIKSQSGFTLLEILAVLAVMIILMSLSVPAIVRINRNLDMTKADGMAKEIYIAAQNKLYYEKASGYLSNFQAALEDKSTQTGVCLKDFNKCPSDYEMKDGEAKNSNWENLYYGSSTDTSLKFMSYVLPSATVIQISGDYIIEANPYTAEVYGVFYKEKASKNDNGMTLEQIYKTLYSNRDKQSREAYLVGYYGGSETGKAYRDLSNVDVEVVNGEQLAIEATYKSDAEIITGTPVLCVELTDESGHVFEDEIGFTSTGGIDTSNKGETSFRIDDGTGNNSIRTNTDGSKTIRYVLDSLEDTYRFNYTGTGVGFGLVAGENITAKVKLVIKDSEGQLRTDLESASKSITFNSLYADGSDTSTIMIANNRHLNNLRSDRVNEAPYVEAYNQRANAGQDDASLKIIQTGDIDFNSKEKTGVSPDFDEFTAISNSYFFTGKTGETENSTAIASFDGQGNEIRNYNIVAEKGDGASLETGLFSRTSCDISNVRLVNTTVEGKGNAGTGTLVGLVSGGKIDHCGAYLLSDIDKHETKNVDANMRSKYSVKGTGTKNIGGLIGKAEGSANIVNCFAAVDAKPGVGSTNVGGLIGSVAGSASIEQCYSSGDIEAGENAGGLIGYLEQGKVKDCYSTADVVEKTANSSKAGSFVGYASGGKITSCKSYGTVNYGNTTTTNSNACAFGNTANNAANSIFTDCKYFCFAKGHNGDKEYKDYNTQFSGKANGAEATAEPELGDGTAAARKANSHPYKSLDVNTTDYFPFKDFVQAGEGAIVSHYGDWFYATADQVQQSAYLVYYEKYEDNSYGYYSEELGIDTLRNYEPNDISKDKYLVEDGYAVLSDKDNEWKNKISYTINGTEHKDVNVNNGQSDAFTPNGTVTASGKTYNVYLLPFSLQYNCNTEGANSFSKSGNFYDALVITKVNGEEVKEPVTYFYNPHFAKCISDKHTSDEANKNVPETLIIRSARQFNLLGKLSYYWNSDNNGGNGDKLPSNLIYKQELDIDFSTYNTQSYRNKNISFDSGNFANEMIGNDNTPFKYTYDGDSFVIADYKLSETRNSSSDNFIGMFGTVTGGKLQNINLLAKTTGTGEADSSGKIYVSFVGNGGNGFAVGALAGSLNGSVTVSNCSISDYVVQVDGKDGTWLTEEMAVGGLVGMVGKDAKVEKSYSVCKYVGFDNILVSIGWFIRRPTVATSGLAGVNYGAIDTSYSGSHLYANFNKGWGYGIVRCAGIANVIELAGNKKDGSCTNCYSYSKVENSSTAYFGNDVKKYGISPANNTNSYYYSDNMSDAVTGSGTAYNYDQMKGLKNNEGFKTAGYGSVEGYDLPLIVKNIKTGAYIHYAEKPQK